MQIDLLHYNKCKGRPDIKPGSPCSLAYARPRTWTMYNFSGQSAVRPSGRFAAATDEEINSGRYKEGEEQQPRRRRLTS